MYLPGSQRVQVSSEVAPVLEENLPVPHGLHVDSEVAPDSVEYLPAPHKVQLDRPLLAFTKYFPGSQSVQFDDPVDAAYFPCGHGTQFELPGLDCSPTSQSRHALTPVAPVTVEYFPA